MGDNLGQWELPDKGSRGTNLAALFWRRVSEPLSGDVGLHKCVVTLRM
jgi:hypothetical protein